MRLKEFRSINVLEYPVLYFRQLEDRRLSRVPRNFFLFDNDHMIYVVVDHKTKSAMCYNSLSLESDSMIYFIPVLKAAGLETISQFFSVNFQKVPGSESCAIYAVLFSLGVFYRTNEFNMMTNIKEQLKLLKVQWQTRPQPIRNLPAFSKILSCLYRT